MEREKTDELLTPITRTTKRFYIFVGILVAIIALFGYAWYTQLTQGLVVTGMRDIPGGAPWGLYIANFVHAIAAASPGMAISVMVHQLKLEKYRPIARIGELLAVIFLTLSMIFVMFDLGRPDRFLNLFIHGRTLSPFVWDLIIVIAYLSLSIIALYLILRRDLLACIGKVSKIKRRVYGFLVGGYKDTPTERVLTKRLMKWISAGILVVMVLVHTAVVPYIFGLLPGRPGWYNPFFGAYFGVAHVATGLATIIVAAAVVRFLYKWDEHLKPEIFQGLGKFLAALNLIYLHFMFSEQITMRFAGPAAEFGISQAWLFGEQAWLFWPAVAMLVVSTLMIIAPRTRTVRGIFIASILAIMAYWIKRVLIVASALLSPLLYPGGVYVPTWVEWSLMGGAFIIGILLFTIFLKMFPIVELPIRKTLHNPVAKVVKPQKGINPPKVVNNWLVVGIISLFISAVSVVVGYIVLALTVLLTGGIIFLIGAYIQWFHVYGAKKPEKNGWGLLPLALIFLIIFSIALIFAYLHFA